MISEQEFKDAADIISCEVAAIKAVYFIEAAGRGYLDDGRVKILFEGHRFWKNLKKAGIDCQYWLNKYPNHSNVLYPTWDKRQYKGGKAEWDRMSEVIQFCREMGDMTPTIALDSASYGSFQIMGENHSLCGYADSQEMLTKYNNGGEAEQLASFCRFIKSTHLDDELRDKNWAKFAQGYNGSQFALNKYDVKLAKAYDTYK